MGFHLAILVFECVTSTHRFRFEEKVYYSVFKVKNGEFSENTKFEQRPLRKVRCAVISDVNCPTGFGIERDMFLRFIFMFNRQEVDRIKGAAQDMLEAKVKIWVHKGNLSL